MKTRLLVTNGSYRNTLAAVRGFKNSNFEVFVCDKNTRNCSSLSRYVKGKDKYCSPLINEELFIENLLSIIKRRSIQILLPIGTDTTLACAKNRSALRDVVTPIADFNEMVTAHDKYQTYLLAKKLNIPVPKTNLWSEICHTNLEELDYPLVVKARMASGEFAIVNNTNQLCTYMDELHSKKNTASIVEYNDPVVQQYISGYIHDALVLYNQGVLKTIVTQKRVLTVPASGGPGVLNTTTDEPVIKNYAKLLFDELNWHGVAMAEFMVDDKTGIPYLIEINPKFWGTLGLAIAAGVNFPLLAAQMALKGDCEPPQEYLIGATYRWFFPFLIKHLKTTENKKEALKQYFNLLEEKQFSDIDKSDLLPNLYLMAKSVRLLFKSGH